MLCKVTSKLCMYVVDYYLLDSLDRVGDHHGKHFSKLHSYIS